MRRAPFLFASAFAVIALAGCSANVSASASAAGEGADADSAGSISAPRALVAIESTTSPAGDRKASAVARFVRARDGVIDEDALRMVHASLALPAIGTCAAPDAEPNAARGVTLADLGSVGVVTGTEDTALVPRELPDVADLVSGVVYTSGSDGASLPAGARYAIHASGGDNVPGFVASAVAPSELAGLRIADHDLASDVTADAASALDLAWDAGDSADVVYVDLTSAGSDAPALRCAFADSGHGSVAVDAWTGAIGGATGTLTLHRLHREALRAAGVDSGEVRFDFARSVALHVR